MTDGVMQARAISFFELRDGSIWRVMESWPDPFPPAEWRARWSERAGAEPTRGI